MPSINGDMARYDLNDPEDLAVLIDRGLVWMGGPRTTQLALKAIVDGVVPRPSKNVPPEVNAYLDKLGIPPAPEAPGVPAEPSDEDFPIEGDDADGNDVSA